MKKERAAFFCNIAAAVLVTAVLVLSLIHI